MHACKLIHDLCRTKKASQWSCSSLRNKIKMTSPLLDIDSDPRIILGLLAKKCRSRSRNPVELMELEAAEAKHRMQF